MAEREHRPAIGAMVHRDVPPDQLAGRARLLEALGYEQAWVVEDCFWTGGVATATLVLASTERIHVGLGVLPAVLRNAALAAMEVATLAGAFPGRLTVGFGHGVAGWMRQVGAHPTSPHAALTETMTAVRDLLDGATVTVAGRHVALDDVTLVFPPGARPALLAGVTGPRGLAAAGAIGDGAILPEAAPPAFVRQARDALRRASSGSTEPIVVIYALLGVDDDAERARRELRPVVAEWITRYLGRPQFAATTFADQAAQLVEAHGRVPPELVPFSWLDELAVVGAPADCVRAIRRFGEAGADSVVLVPPFANAERQLTVFAETVLPLLTAPAPP